MNKHILAVAFAAAILSGPAYVFAGAKTSAPVTIDLAARRAAGSLGSTRNVSPSGSYIGCQIIATTTGSAPSFNCSARVGGASPVFRNCAGSVSAMVQAAASVTTDSYIVFTWDANGVCNSLTVTNYSDYEPKAP